MTQYIADEDHYKKVLELVPKVKRSLWIGTADIKDLYVEDTPFLGVLACLVRQKREVRLIHAKSPDRTSVKTSTGILSSFLAWNAPFARASISKSSSST